MDFSFAPHDNLQQLEWFFSGLSEVMVRRGHKQVDNPDQASLVINPFTRDEPKLFRRRGQAVFVVGVTELAPG